ncbi:LAGLIDADG family homing endonuclease [Halorubrum aethiopicum]|uniref:LAGLIDADG family homing endonuclease n=1 Tax=Halorubrum aethiopicum TaxID=1758255 RepID=UPI00082F28C4|nr:LAGLIDADG family homing endonuclease [Halorubrum aethiopicum]
MAQAGNQDLTERFIQFYRNYYREEIGTLAQKYPNEQRSLYVEYDDLFQFDRDLAEDFLTKPDQMREYAEEALRLYDLPADVSLGRAHVRLRNLPENIDIRGIRVHDDHIGKLVSVQGIVRKATDVRPKVTEAAFECQRCGTMTYIPQSDGGFQEPHECQGCERQGPFRVNFDQSEFIDSQKLRIQESPEGLRGGETPQSLDVDIVDDVTGKVSPGDHVTCVGVLHIEQVEQGNEKSAIFDLYMDGVSIAIEDEEFEDMDITDEDRREIIELSNRDDIYEAMVDSIAPAIYGYEEEKLAMILQLFSGVTKHLPDGSRIRGDLHMLLIGDPGTGKCVAGDTNVLLNDGREVPIRELVERNLDDLKPVDDGVWDSVDFEVPALQEDGAVGASRATKVWKREAPEEMYRVETASGRELDVTPSHPLFVQRDGQFAPVRAEELEAGEFVATPARLDVDANDTLDVDFRKAQSYNAVRLDAPERWTPALSRLIGYIVAEGYVEKRDDHSGFVSITNDDEEVLEDARNTLDDLNLETTTRKPHDGKSARELLCSAGEFVSFLNEIDEALLKSSAEKRVPPRLAGASDEITAAFVEGFIEGEGHVSASQREITVASMSEELLEGVRSLLLQHAITSQLHERHNGSYRLRISGAQFDRYVTEIGFVTERKQSAAEEHLETDRNTNVDVIPNVGPTLRRLRESLGLTQYECGVPRSTYRHYEAESRKPSRQALKRIVDAFEDACGSPVDGDTDVLAKTDGGATARNIAALRRLAESDIRWDRIESIERVESEDEWVYDLEVEGTHNYVSNGVVSHNSQMISYVENIAPRSVYTSGKGSSAAGLTAAAVRDDFGDGQQWSLEAGALVLADKGIAAVDELDKMDSSDRSAMHEGLEQQKISVSKAGINATLKARCSLLGAANPKYGRFDQYEPIGEQIDLEPALISRFDLIFTVTDQPDPEHDSRLAKHIIKTNYAGELNTQREELATSEFTSDQVAEVTQEVAPAIDAELLRKYIAHAKRSCYPTMTEEAKELIEEFYVDLRSKGADEDAPVPVTARKLEALVRLSEASARVRLSDTVDREDADRATDIVESCLQDIGVDPETGQFDADVVETGTSKSQRDRIKNIKGLIADIETEYEEGAPVDEVLDRAGEIGMDPGKAEQEIEKLRTKGEVYEPQQGHLRTT